MKLCGEPSISHCDKGSSASTFMRPASDSAAVGSMNTLAELVSRKRPGTG